MRIFSNNLGACHANPSRTVEKSLTVTLPGDAAIRGYSVKVVAISTTKDFRITKLG